MKTKKVLIIAGGTGGHVFPALAVARLLKKKNIDVAWLGTKKSLENKIVPLENIPLYSISVTGLRGKGLLRWLIAPFQLSCALFSAIKIIYKYRPDIVLGMGGFVSGPGGLAAWLLRKKLIIHEQNAIPGMTNKILARFASLVLLGFPIQISQSSISNPRSYYVGNPVRSELTSIPSPHERLIERSEPFHLLIIGGSLGALFFNRAIPEALTLLANDKKPEVWHIAGDRNLSVAREAYQKAGIKARIDGFVNDMASAYKWADLIICRAGALTIAEISATGSAAILIPFPHAVDDHQTANARFLADANAALLLPQNGFTPDKLADLITKLMTDRKQLITIAEKSWQLRKIDAAEKIAELLATDSHRYAQI